jgi:predicted enzyme related to lactoylglutathione lyase
MQMPEVPRGRFVWHDLMAADARQAETYYTKLLGWGTSAWDSADMPYTMWTREDTPLGGVMELPEDARQSGALPHWLAYVAVPDVDGAVAETEAAGGTARVPPTDIPTVGRFAIIADPQGATLAVFCPAGGAPGHDGPPRIGEFSWHELAATDHEAAFAFHSSLFGWERMQTLDLGEAGSYQIFGRAGLPLGGMFNKPAQIPGPPFWLCYIRVDNVGASVERVGELGGRVLNGPLDVPGGDTVAQCLDPQGAAFALHSTAGT